MKNLRQRSDIWQTKWYVENIFTVKWFASVVLWLTNQVVETFSGINFLMTFQLASLFWQLVTCFVFRLYYVWFDFLYLECCSVMSKEAHICGYISNPIPLLVFFIYSGRYYLTDAYFLSMSVLFTKCFVVNR